jgi:hypothetical protein
MDPSCGYQMLWSLILIRFQSYEAIPLVIAFPTLSQRTDEDNSDISRIRICAEQMSHFHLTNNGGQASGG